VDPVPPSPESQEDEVDREDDEISLAPGSQERVFLKGTFATSLMRV
jgi:hypothetical protein